MINLRKKKKLFQYINNMENNERTEEPDKWVREREREKERLC